MSDRPEARDRLRRPLLGFGFWLLIAFGLLCVLAGAGVVALGPRLLPADPHAASSTPAPTPSPAAAPGRAVN